MVQKTDSNLNYKKAGEITQSISGRSGKLIPGKYSSEDRKKLISMWKELKEVKSILLRDQLANEIRINNGHTLPKEPDINHYDPQINEYIWRLNSQSHYERALAMTDIANLKSDVSKLVPIILRIMDSDKEEGMRCYATGIIGKICRGEKEKKMAVPFLINILGEQNGDLRRLASVSLGMIGIGDKYTISILETATTIERDLVIRESMRKALDKLRNKNKT